MTNCVESEKNITAANVAVYAAFTAIISQVVRVLHRVCAVVGHSRIAALYVYRAVLGYAEQMRQQLMCPLVHFRLVHGLPAELVETAVECGKLLFAVFALLVVALFALAAIAVVILAPIAVVALIKE